MKNVTDEFVESSIFRLLISVIFGTVARNTFPILIFHRVVKEPDPIRKEIIDSISFSWIMSSIAHYFNVLPLSEAIKEMKNNSLPQRTIAITFDDGYSDNVEVALPILKRFGLHATFFISTGYLEDGWMWNDGVIEAVSQSQGSCFDLSSIGLGSYRVESIQEKRETIDTLLPRLKYEEPEKRRRYVEEMLEMASASVPKKLMMNIDQVRVLVQAGMEIGGHTVSHPILSTIDDRAAYAEIKENKDHLEALTGEKIRLFAYPNGKPGKDYGREHVKMVKEIGYYAAVSTSWGCADNASDIYQLPRFTPWEREPGRFMLRLLEQSVRSKIFRFNRIKT